MWTIYHLTTSADLERIKYNKSLFLFFRKKWNQEATEEAAQPKLAKKAKAGEKDKPKTKSDPEVNWSKENKPPKAKKKKVKEGDGSSVVCDLSQQFPEVFSSPLPNKGEKTKTKSPDSPAKKKSKKPIYLLMESVMVKGDCCCLINYTQLIK